MRWFPIALAVLLLSGCFGEDGDSRDRASADFVRQANGICRESNVRIKALGKPPERGTPEYARYVRDTQVIARQVTAKMNRLRAPRGLDPQLKQWREQIDTLSRRMRSVRRATARVEADIRANRFSGAGPEAHLDALSKAERAALASIESLDRLSREAGLTECVRQE